MLSRYPLAFCISFLVLYNGSRVDQNPLMFKKLTSAQTDITFSNTITTSDSVNMLNNVFIYNGAGVATGDINNDGLIDIYFTGNMVSSRLYLNKGNMQFEDITKKYMSRPPISGEQAFQWLISPVMACWISMVRYRDPSG